MLVVGEQGRCSASVDVHVPKAWNQVFSRRVDNPRILWRCQLVSLADLLDPIALNNDCAIVKGWPPVASMTVT
jgi:hypothetical protein